VCTHYALGRALHCVGTTPRRVFGANCCHAQHGVHTHRTKHPTSARADDGGWRSAVSPSFLTTSNFFAVAAPPGPVCLSRAISSAHSLPRPCRMVRGRSPWRRSPRNPYTGSSGACARRGRSPRNPYTGSSGACARRGRSPSTPYTGSSAACAHRGRRPRTPDTGSSGACARRGRSPRTPHTGSSGLVLAERYLPWHLCAGQSVR
jgi:hypothetical protein